ncbi:MAG: hypothetical protein F4X72_11955 [Dehalococcoidia bacterium]|nr:hypothetical protein [Dehalococcoidia bacterium]MYD52096.1 hypothetical protein [Dehalococcoidia bacterium]
MNESASWFLVSEGGAPLGQIYCKDGRIEPTVGETLENGQKWTRAEVLSFEELRASCGMRRFRIVIRVIE